MGLITGNEYTVQYGIEAAAAYGTAVVPTKEILVTKVDAKVQRDLKETGENTGGQIANKGYSAARSTELSLSFLARPDQLGDWLFCAMGKEAAVSASGDGHAHTFTLSKPSAAESLPSMTIVVDFKTAIKGYNGCKVESLKINAASGDLLKVDVTLRGLDEAVDTLETLTPSALAPMRFSGATFQVDTVPFLCDNVSFELTNNLDKTKSTIALAEAATMYYDAPEPQVRGIAVTGNALYSAAVETLRDGHFLDAGDVIVATVLNFKGAAYHDAEVYNLSLTIPSMQIQEDPLPGFTLQKLMSSISLKAVQSATGEPLTAVLINESDALILPAV
jgi:hypothetical protein